MSSEMIIVNIRRRKIDKSDEGRMIDDVELRRTGKWKVSSIIWGRFARLMG